MKKVFLFLYTNGKDMFIPSKAILITDIFAMNCYDGKAISY